MNLPEVEIFSDGGARPNPGAGAYGIVMKYKGVVKEFSGFETNTTNNRMELTGAIIGLEKLTKKSKVNLYTDSKYTIDGIEKGWAKKWKQNNWMRTKTEKAINSDLWERLLNIVEKHEVKFHWVKGHNGHIENERCDSLATEEILKNKRNLFYNKESPNPNLLLKERGQKENEDLRKIGIIENYIKVPNYILGLSRDLRKRQTDAEKYMWEILRNRQLNNLKFRRQYAFGRYISDFYCFEKNLVIELDGGIHNLGEQIEYDKIRTEIISKNKINILRIKNEEIFDDIENVIKKILYFCSCSSPSGEVGGGQNNKIKIIAEGQVCRKCGTKVIKAIPKKKNTKNKSYYYKYYLNCPGCSTNYFVDEAKVLI